MADYADLRARLRHGLDPSDLLFGWQREHLEAVTAIEALEAERDELFVTLRNLSAGERYERERAEKAEADLAAARAALRDAFESLSGRMAWIEQAFPGHASAIAAARAEQGGE